MKYKIVAIRNSDFKTTDKGNNFFFFFLIAKVLFLVRLPSNDRYVAKKNYFNGNE